MISPPNHVRILLLFVALCTATSLDLCSFDSNATISPESSITWGQALTEPLRRFAGPSYLRPSIGGALQPWVITVIILILHIPVVIIRVVRWENAQILCLVATLFSNIVVAQAYASTQFQASKVLTWTPLLLVIDAGSMAHIFFLVIEEFNILTRLRATFPNHRLGSSSEHLLENIEPAVERPQIVERANNEKVDIHIPKSADLQTPHLHLSIAHPGLDEIETLFQATHEVDADAPEALMPIPFTVHILRAEEHAPLFKSKPFYIALLSAMLFFTVVILQILGLAHAAEAARQPPPMVSHCSPIFQPLGITVLDGNCNNHPVQHNDAGYNANGIGCILLPGLQQLAWLRATVAGVSIALVLETIDIVVLARVSSGYRWREVKMRRPWCTMIPGVATLFLLLIFGALCGDTLPPGITSRIWVVRQEGAGVGVYEGWLGPAGLRGAIIGWSDGVFEAWGGTYSGHYVG